MDISTSTPTPLCSDMHARLTTFLPGGLSGGKACVTFAVQLKKTVASDEWLVARKDAKLVTSSRRSLRTNRKKAGSPSC